MKAEVKKWDSLLMKGLGLPTQTTVGTGLKPQLWESCYCMTNPLETEEEASIPPG